MICLKDVLKNITKNLFLFSAKKLPKYDQNQGQSGQGQGRRLAEGDQGAKSPGNCCKWWPPAERILLAILSWEWTNCAPAL